MAFSTLLGLAIIMLVALVLVKQFFLTRQVRQCEARVVAEKIKSEKLLLLDVRTPAELRNGQIAGALNIPVQELGRRLAELEKYREREIVVYCASGQRSLRAAHLLQKRGFNVVNMRGGMTAWRALPQA